MGDTEHSAKIASIQVIADPVAWRQALAAVDQEQRRLVEYGVLPGELDREIDDARTSLRERVAAAATRRTPQLADMIVDAQEELSVVQTSEPRSCPFRTGGEDIHRVGRIRRRTAGVRGLRSTAFHEHPQTDRRRGGDP